MDTPAGARTFEIQRPVDAGDFYGVRSHALWPIDGPDVELQWLPLLGPTCYCLLRVFARDMNEATQIFDPIAYNVAELGELLNVPNQRVLHTLRRLQEFRLLRPDDDNEETGRQVYIVDRFIPELTHRQWQRLPESVRNRTAAP